MSFQDFIAAGLRCYWTRFPKNTTRTSILFDIQHCRRQYNNYTRNFCHQAGRRFSSSGSSERTRAWMQFGMKGPNTTYLKPQSFHDFLSPIAIIGQASYSSTSWQSNRRQCLREIERCELEHARRKQFHTSARQEFPWPLWCVPYWPAIAALLKSSGALAWTQTIGRVALTLFPLAVVKRKFIRKFIKHFPPEDHPTLANVHAHFLKHAAGTNLMIWSLILVPFALVAVTLLASLERTPLTGRWRMILLSPEEEQKVADDLTGDGWYNAVAGVLAANSPNGLPRVLPLGDWRTQWVLDTMRRLEHVVPLLYSDKTLPTASNPDMPFPPPSQYPLLPRPRFSTSLHHIFPDSDAKNHATHDPAPHTLLGPPYSLLVVERPDSGNAFSYGFGPNGGGGVVVFSGFIDEILRKYPAQAVSSHQTSLWSKLTKPSDPQSAHFTPTPEQTSQLAILLAHEMSHLILSHHLETLSSGAIVTPTIISIVSDFARTLLFPVTMLFGPFINDALLEISKIGIGEVTTSSEACMSKKLEIEADIVSARLLAYAGFDPRSAVDFWVTRAEAETCAAASKKQETPSEQKAQWFSHREDHPISEVRVQKLKEELSKWQAVREKEQKPQKQAKH